MNSVVKDCNISTDNLYKYYVKQNLTYSMIPLGINWKTSLNCEFSRIRFSLISFDNFDYQE